MENPGRWYIYFYLGIKDICETTCNENSVSFKTIFSVVYTITTMIAMM